MMHKFCNEPEKGICESITAIYEKKYNGYTHLAVSRNIDNKCHMTKDYYGIEAEKLYDLLLTGKNVDFKW